MHITIYYNDKPQQSQKSSLTRFLLYQCLFFLARNLTKLFKVMMLCVVGNELLKAARKDLVDSERRIGLRGATLRLGAGRCEYAHLPRNLIWSGANTVVRGETMRAVYDAPRLRTH